MRLPRMTIGRWMIAMAVVCVLLGSVEAVRREIEREFPSTPAGWAWEWAAAYDRWADDPFLATRYRELAIAFQRTGEAWAEGTYLGPFTDKRQPGSLSLYRRVAVRSDPIPSVLDAATASVGPSLGGPSAQSLEDWALDQDACVDSRGILLRLADGPHRGEVVLVERVYLRRGP